MNENTNGSYVYLLHAQGTNRFKIGYSEDPIRRLKSINTYSSPFPIVLIASYFVEKNPLSEEQRLHKELSKNRVYKEWFEFDSVEQAKEIVGAKIGLPDITSSHKQYGVLPSIDRTSRLFLKLTNKLDTNRRKRDNEVVITKAILKEVINKAIQDLNRDPKHSDDYMAKALALQLFTGKELYNEILDTESSFLAKKSVHLLAKTIPDSSPVDLIESNLSFIRCHVVEKRKYKTPTMTLLFYPIMRSLMSYDKLLKEVRTANENMPWISFDPKKQYLRSFYAFSCWVFLDQCQSVEDEYIDSLFK